MAKDKSAVESHYPVYVAGTTPERIKFIGEPYVGYVAFRGYTPMVDIVTMDSETDMPARTLIINQVSLSRQLSGRIQIGEFTNKQVHISRVAPGRMAPYKVE